MTALHRLNRLNRQLAEFMNPNGYYRCLMPAFATFGELRRVFELHDKWDASVPLRHGNPHSLHNSGFDSLAFYAAHDRYHLRNDLTFEWEDEMRVGALHYADLRSFDEKAARLQLAITLTGAHWDREIGEGYAPNWPEALKQTTRQMEAEGKWEDLGTGQDDIFDSYEYMRPWLGSYLEMAR